MAVMKAQQNEMPLSEADEIEAMLPWLVTGKLSRSDEARVTRYLEAHPATAAHVALARGEQDAAISGNEAIAGPGQAALDRLMAEIARTPQPRQLSVPSPASVWDRFARFVGGFSPTTLGIAGAAAAIVLVAQAATIGMLVTRDVPGATYGTASGGTRVAADGIRAYVTLQPGITSAALTTALVELKASMIDGPRAGGVYQLRIAGDTAEAQVALARVKARSDIFAFVGPASR
jgi:anti-sigma factor RsiW